MRTRAVALVAAVLLLLPSAAARRAAGHCDTLDGPVVAAARAALERGEPGPALIWIQRDDEPELRAAFAKTPEARALGKAAADVADTWFFETLVRLHRRGEGAPYEGLKPAGTDPGAAGEAPPHEPANSGKHHP